MGFLKNIFGVKNAPAKSYEDFWAWFKKNEKAFYKVINEDGDIEQDFFDKLSPKLEDIEDGFFYLTGMFSDTAAELILTADSVIKNIVFVEELVAAAPLISGWKFTAHKPPLKLADVNIEMDGYKFGAQNISFYSNDYTEYPDEIDITLAYNGFNDENGSTVANGVLIFLENLLGELNFVETIDAYRVIGKDKAEKELIPVEKLKDFLTWRQMEFVEKYGQIRYKNEGKKGAIFEAKNNEGKALVAMINTSLLEWDGKASHPWIMTVELKYNGENNNGMPDKETQHSLVTIEDEITEYLEDSNGFLNIGRQTGNNLREIYFVCRDFRKPSKILYNIQHKYKGKFDIQYDIYKDKYWQSFNRFMGSKVVE